MDLDFVKMHGAGNDYVLVDGFAQPAVIASGTAISAAISDRRFGIGSDGLIVAGPSTVADVRMWMWNADGSRGAMCGNGLRLLAAFAIETGRVATDTMTIETDSGVLCATVLRDSDREVTAARVQMPPVRVSGVHGTIIAAERELPFREVDVGNPHAVVFVDEDPEQVPLEAIAAAVRQLPQYPLGVNVEVVRVAEPDVLVQRTFERGSGETWACGSGATATAMAAIQANRIRAHSIRVRMRGGEVTVHRLAPDRAELEGPVVRVYRGSVRTLAGWVDRHP